MKERGHLHVTIDPRNFPLFPFMNRCYKYIKRRFIFALEIITYKTHSTVNLFFVIIILTGDITWTSLSQARIGQPEGKSPYPWYVVFKLTSVLKSITALQFWQLNPFFHELRIFVTKWSFYQSFCSTYSEWFLS